MAFNRMALKLMAQAGLPFKRVHTTARRAAWLLTALAPLALAQTAAPRPKPVQVRYMLWDSQQLPAYRECAKGFAARHPGIQVKILQAGWGDYWTAITTGFIAGVAPDVFTNHLSKYPEFVANGLLQDLSPYIARDGVDLGPGQFPPGLVKVWGREGRQYGLPKDWDTVGLVVNLDHAQRQGVTLAELQQMAWNPQDGGSFEQVLRRLAVDKAGRSAHQAGFNPQAVAVYGYQNPGPGGMAGQLEWSHFAVSNGFRFQAEPWAKPYRYDDPQLAETLTWLAGLPAKGLSAPLAQVRSLGASAMFSAGQVALVPDGAWMINYYAGIRKFKTTWVPLPKGPSGQRASMLNGLGDSMWVGSKVKEQAWQWMKYLASADCQSVVARHSVVFPALNGMAEQVMAQHRAKGVDASAFQTMAQGQTFLMPIAEHGAQVEELMNGAIEAVLLGQQAAGPALAKANAQVNRLLATRPGQRRP